MTDTVFAGTHSIDADSFRRALVAWGERHFRRFPWRLTENPYRILIAEIMLHRTQARQVVPVYDAFIERYPDVQVLAEGSSEELGAVLFPLGLRWRNRLIPKLAAELMKRFSGEVPERKEDLLSLPGVSSYIAGAVRCFAWNLPEPLLDTNTVRVVGRVFGLETRDSSRRSRRFAELIAVLLDRNQPRSYNYALLDLAGQVCSGKRPPECDACPLVRFCVYASTQGHRQ